MQREPRSTIPKRRIAQKLANVDFPLMLQELNRSGCRFEDIAELTGLNKSTLKSVSQDMKPVPQAWEQAVRLIDMYLLVTEKETLPFI